MDLSSLAAGDPAARRLLAAIPDALLKRCAPVQFSTGDAVALRDEPVDYVYFLLTGEFSTFVETADGKMASSLVMPAPDMVSDLEMLAQKRTYANSVYATADTVALRCSAADFQAALEQSPAFLREVARRFAQKSYRLSYNQGGAAFRSGLEKVALSIINICAIDPPAPGESLILPRTRASISSLAVVSLKTVNRSVYTLRDRGYLSLVRGKISVSHSQYARLLEDWWTSDIPPAQSIWPKG